jgi:YjbE family integral membrane protein
LVFVWLLKIPGLLLIGGILLAWIAYKLIVEEKGHDNIKSGVSTWSAIKTIVIADTVMGLDNVLAVAGAAHGNFLLVVLGLLISIPIIVYGSTLILGLIKRFPATIYIGAAVLAWTAAKMIIGEPLLKEFFSESLVLKWGVQIIIVGGVILYGKIKKQGASGQCPESHKFQQEAR